MIWYHTGRSLLLYRWFYLSISPMVLYLFCWKLCGSGLMFLIVPCWDAALPCKDSFKRANEWIYIRRHKYVEVFLSWSSFEITSNLFTLILSSVRVPLGCVMSLSLHKVVMFVSLCMLAQPCCWKNTLCSGTPTREGLKHIEPETKWPPFYRRYLQMYLLEWKCTNFD